MKHYFLLICCWFWTAAAPAQIPNARKQIYAQYFKENIFQYDSLTSKAVDKVVVWPLDAEVQRLDLDTAYLADYLKGRLGRNETYKKYVQPAGRDALSWLWFPSRLPQLLKQDREVGEMLVNLSASLAGKHIIPSAIQLGNTIIADNTASKAGKRWNKFFKEGGWEVFYQHYLRCYGIVEFSDVVFSVNNQRAAFFVQVHRDGLDGGGGVMFMKLTPEGWEEDFFLQFWVS